MLKYFIFFFFLPFCTASLSQEKTFLDVKTKMVEKAKLTHIKTATVWLISQTEWGGVTEVTGDYQLWIKDYSKVQNDNVITVNVTIELRTAKVFGEGELIASQPINVVFVLDIDNEKADNQYQFYKNKFSRFSYEKRTEAYEVGNQILETTFQLLNKYDKP